MSTSSPTGPVLVASDVHLGSISAEQEAAFLTWLEQAGDVASWIILNGDLFDFWFEYLWGTTRGHEKALARLRSVVDGGTRVTLMGGNHDWWGGRVLREEIGVEYHQDAIGVNVAGHETLVAHGDGLGNGDLGYRVLRTILRSRLTRWSFAMLPPGVGDRVAGLVSKTEDRWEAPGPTELARAAALEAWAIDHMRNRPELDLLLLGHTHVPQMIEVDEGRWYVNSGDWVFNRSYVIVREGHAPRLEQWSGEIRV